MQRLARPPAAVVNAASPATGGEAAAAALPAACAIRSNFGPARPAPATRPLHICRRPPPSRFSGRFRRASPAAFSTDADSMPNSLSISTRFQLPAGRSDYVQRIACRVA